MRNNVTVIPQDPTLFNSTLRYNLDPFGTYTTEQLESLLIRAGLEDLIKRSSSNGVDLIISENGSNLAVGEKQLICICRAILRKNKVIILDEATANIDVLTEQKILKLIKEEFKDATVITIAHRLNTIIESDMILVMGNGKVIEYDSPMNLMQDTNSEFAQLLKELKKK